MKNNAILKFVMLVMIGVGVIGLSGCNTVQGLGKDMSKLGDKIENKAEEKKSY
jgi:entericidin A